EQNSRNSEIERGSDCVGLRPGLLRGFAQSLRSNRLLIFQRETERLNFICSRLCGDVYYFADLSQIIGLDLNYIGCRIAGNCRLAALFRVSVSWAERITYCLYIGPRANHLAKLGQRSIKLLGVLSGGCLRCLRLSDYAYIDLRLIGFSRDGCLSCHTNR